MTLTVKQDPKKEIPFEVMAESISAIAKSLRSIDQTRATRKLIVALIHDTSRIPKGTIEIVQQP